MRCVGKIIFALIVWGCLTLPCTAQSLSDTIALEEVTVVAGLVNKEVIPVQVLSGVELSKLSVNSVADAIRYFSGVQIKDFGGIGGLKTVNIRSMGSQHVGVFYDGVEVGNAQNGVVDLGRFSLDNMEAVTIYNGQKSSIFQPAKDYASAGALYMKSRIPVFEKGRRENWKLQLRGGSFLTGSASLLWERRLTDSVSLTLNGASLYTSGRYRFSYSKKNGYDTTEVRRNGDVRYLRMEGSIFGKIRKGEWQGKVYYYQSERGYPGASVREEPGKFRHEDRQWDRNFFVQSSLRRHFTNRYSLLLTGKYANDYLHYRSDPRLDVTAMYVDNHYLQQEAFLSAAHLYAPATWCSLSLSNDIQWNTLSSDLVDFVYPDRLQLLTAVATSVDYHTIKVQAALLHTYVHDYTRAALSPDPLHNLSPSVIASWKPFASNINLRAFYKRVFRMPTLNDLYYTFIGNISLKPEATNQYNLGATYSRSFSSGLLNRLDMQVDGYFNQVENKIIAMPTSNQFRWTMMNLGYVEIRGLDAAIQGAWSRGVLSWHTRLTYTFQKAQDFTDRTSEWYGGQIPYIPWHSGSVVLGGSYRRWTWNYSFIYTGERYESVANIPENHALPWYTHDLSLSVKYGRNQLTAEVNNLFNQQYEVVKCYPMPGININLKWSLLL